MGNFVDLKFYGYLNEYTAGKALTNIECEEGVSVRELLSRLSVPAHVVGFISVNEKLIDLDYRLCNGDTVKIYPLIIGG